MLFLQILQGGIANGIWINFKKLKKLLLILLCTPLIGFGQGIYPYGYEKGSILVNDYGDTIYTITKNEDG